MAIPLSASLRVPEDVLISEVGGEAVLLDLRSEQYFGLDDVGTDMWAALTQSATIQAALEKLSAQYQADEAQLRQDLTDLLEKLHSNGLVEIVL
jgi:hypothetical protein